MDKAEILTRVNKICKRSETDIDDILLESLKEISGKCGILIGEASGTTVSGTAYISAPSDLVGKLVHSVQLDDNDPLNEITWTQYLQQVYQGYCVHDGKIYIVPTPLGEDYNVQYSYFDDDVDNIELSDEWLPAVVRLTASKLYEKYERYEEVENQITLYEREYRRLRRSPVTPVCVYKEF